MKNSLIIYESLKLVIESQLNDSDKVNFSDDLNQTFSQSGLDSFDFVGVFIDISEGVGVDDLLIQDNRIEAGVSFHEMIDFILEYGENKDYQSIFDRLKG
jgi:acyl carrier protein